MLADHLRLLLTDASIFEKDMPIDGIRINLFAKDELYMPQEVLKGDIMLLRTVKASSCIHSVGVG